MGFNCLYVGSDRILFIKFLPDWIGLVHGILTEKHQLDLAIENWFSKEVTFNLFL